MKMSRFALTAMIASASFAGTAFGQNNRTAPRYYPSSYYSYYQDGAATQAPAPVASASDAVSTASACGGKSPACDVAAVCNGKGSSCDGLGNCGCGNLSCGGGAGGAGGCDGAGGCGSTGLFGLGVIGTGRKLVDPWKLAPKGIAGVNVGGWTSVGYHSKANPFSFNTYPRRVQLGQQWFFAEKVANGSEGLGFGGRVDYLYGTDAPDTQAFGVTGPDFDNRWVNGPNNLGYGHAMPQLYGEVAAGDLSVKVGRFFTIVGNEVVQATGNFFYSRQFTFYNAEPFTHTGALTTYNVDSDTQIYNGYVMGWDSAFRDNGDAYIGGMKKKFNDTFSMLYSTVLGRFGDANVPALGERGGIQNLILTANLTDKLTYISQYDVLYTTNNIGNVQRNTFGNINYLLYKVNDRVTLGQRFEWFNFGGAGFTDANGLQRKNDDNFNFTTGLNYRAHANLLFRPEVRWVWDRQRYGFNENNASQQVAAGGDMVFTF